MKLTFNHLYILIVFYLKDMNVNSNDILYNFLRMKLTYNNLWRWFLIYRVREWGIVVIEGEK